MQHIMARRLAIWSVLMLWTAACASSVFADERRSGLTPSEIYLPQDHASIEGSHEGNTGKLVICIQDAHANEIAQQNIAKIVQELHKFYSFEMVGVEGSSGFVDTSLFEYFPGTKAKEFLSEFLLRQGKITGAELASIRESGPLVLFGIEDPKLYLANYDSLVDSLAQRKEAMEVLFSFEKNVSAAIHALYPPKLREAEAAWNDFVEERVPARTAFDALTKMAQENNVPTQLFTHLGNYQQLIELEKSIPFAKVDEERAQAVAALAKVLKQSDLKALTGQALRYRQGMLSPLEFHKQLLKYLADHQLAFPSLAQYTEYLTVSEMIDRQGLKSDMEKLEGLIFGKISDRKDVQARARGIAKLLRLTDKFLRLRASREDYLFLQRELPQLGAESLFSSVSAVCRDAHVAFDVSSQQNKVLQRGLESALAFYDLASKRDEALATNLLKEMERTGRNNSILLAGGFHTEGILQHFKSRGVSYVVVLPNVGNKPSEDHYMALLLRKNTPYLDVYRKTKKSDVLSGAIGMISPLRSEDRSVALALTSLFQNFITTPDFQNLRADFLREYSCLLIASTLALHEPGAQDAASAWKASFAAGLKKLGVAVDPQRLENFKIDEKFLEGLSNVQMPLLLSPQELYVPIVVDGAVYVVHFYAADGKPDVLRTASLIQEFDIASLKAQVMDVQGFADALRIRLGAGAEKAVAALNPAVTNQTLAALRLKAPSDKMGADAKVAQSL